MTRQMNATCEMGFWKPETSGCPVCGPDGPCTIDPEALARDQAETRKGRDRRVAGTMIVMAIAALLALLLAGCSALRAPAPVMIPVPTPCVTGDLPDEPRRIQGELTGNSGLDIGIIAGSAIELRAWGQAMLGMLRACQAPPGSVATIRPVPEPQP